MQQLVGFGEWTVHTSGPITILRWIATVNGRAYSGDICTDPCILHSLEDTNDWTHYTAKDVRKSLADLIARQLMLGE